MKSSLLLAVLVAGAIATPASASKSCGSAHVRIERTANQGFANFRVSHMSCGKALAIVRRANAQKLPPRVFGFHMHYRAHSIRGRKGSASFSASVYAVN